MRQNSTYTLFPFIFQYCCVIIFHIYAVVDHAFSGKHDSIHFFLSADVNIPNDLFIHSRVLILVCSVSISCHAFIYPFFFSFSLCLSRVHCFFFFFVLCFRLCSFFPKVVRFRLSFGACFHLHQRTQPKGGT